MVAVLEAELAAIVITFRCTAEFRCPDLNSITVKLVGVAAKFWSFLAVTVVAALSCT